MTMRARLGGMERDELEEYCRELEFYLTQVSGLAVEMFPYFVENAIDHPLAHRCTAGSDAPDCDFHCEAGKPCRHCSEPMRDRLRSLGIDVDGEAPWAS